MQKYKIHDLTPLMRVSLNAEPEAIDIDLERSAVCVIDMQNFDVKPGGAFDLTGVDITHGQRVIAPIQRVLTLARSIGMPVIFTRTGIPRDRLLWPTEDSPWYWKDVVFRSNLNDPAMQHGSTVEGSWGSEIIEELTPQEEEHVVFKHLYSAFQRTDFDLILRRLGTRYLFLTGIGTPTCVEATARDAYFHEYWPIVIQDCCGAILPETHQQALFAIKRRYGWVTSSEHLETAIKAASKQSPGTT